MTVRPLSSIIITKVFEDDVTAVKDVAKDRASDLTKYVNYALVRSDRRAVFETIVSERKVLKRLGCCSTRATHLDEVGGYVVTVEK